MATDAATFRSAVDEVIVEIQAENWTEARKKVAIAELQFSKLPTESRKGPESTRYREQLGKAMDTIDRLEVSTSRSSDNRRFIRTRATFG